MNRISEIVRAIGLNNSAVAVVTTLLLGVVLQSLLFIFGCPCTSWPMWIAFIGISIMLLMTNVRTLLSYWLLVCVLLLLTSYTFCCFFHDAAGHHYAAENILQSGWNPIYESTYEDFEKYKFGMQFASDYVLFLPRLNHLCAALVALSINAFSALPVLGYAFVVLLAACSYRFARELWKCQKIAGMIFALAITSTSKITAIMAGQTDYLLYASALVALFSMLLWIQKRDIADLYCMLLGLVVCMSAKSAGALYGMVMLICATYIGRHDKRIWWFLVVFVVLFLITGFSPYVTSTINYSSPFYPAISLSKAHPAIPMTRDFGGNADAMQMGYFARLCYAWISPSLATRACAWWYEKPEFNPVFNVGGGVAGLGLWFNILLLASVFALVLSRWNNITKVCIVTFIVSNIAPLKWIGFARYFPLVWIIPFLSMYNLAFCPRSLFARVWVQRAFRGSVLLFALSFSGLFLARSTALFFRQLAFENYRQQEVKSINCATLFFKHYYGDYPMLKYYENQGFKIVFSDSPNVSVCEDIGLITIDGDAKEKFKSMSTRYPICDSIRMLKSFDWLGIVRNMPHPLTRREQIEK